MTFCTVLIFTCKNRKYIQTHNLTEYLNNPNEYFEELYCLFIISDTEKRRAILVACCLNKFYDCYASLQTFFNFSITKKTKQNKKRTK